MDVNTEILRKYYDKTTLKPYSKRTELAVKLNGSTCFVATDCGCGSGQDIAYLEKQGYEVNGFDNNPKSISICNEVFESKSHVKISEASFESYAYPKSGVVIANSSLFFADPEQFDKTWDRLESSIQVGGVFAGDFMGLEDSWASGYRSHTTPLSEQRVRSLFLNFEVVKFYERNELSKTLLGRMKHWHTYSVVAIKRR